MSKVKVTLCYEKWSEHPGMVSNSRYKQFELEVPDEWGNPKFKALGYENAQDNVEGGYTPLLQDNDVRNLVGKLLTHIDATFVDHEQRRAQKDIVQQTIYDWEAKLYERTGEEVKWAKIQEEKSKG